MKNIKLDVESLPENFKMSDKQMVTFIRDLFEMIKDNIRIKIKKLILQIERGDYAFCEALKRSLFPAPDPWSCTNTSGFRGTRCR